MKSMKGNDQSEVEIKQFSYSGRTCCASDKISVCVLVLQGYVFVFWGEHWVICVCKIFHHLARVRIRERQRAMALGTDVCETASQNGHSSVENSPENSGNCAVLKKGTENYPLDRQYDCSVMISLKLLNLCGLVLLHNSYYHMFRHTKRTDKI